MAEGKQGRYYTQSFNANKRNYTEIAFIVYIISYRVATYKLYFNNNNIDSRVFKSVDRNNYSKILADLAVNNVIVVNNSYSVGNFSKSYVLHKDMLVAINNRISQLNNSIVYIDLNNYQHLYKIFSSLPSIYVAQPTTDEDNKLNRNYKRELKYEDLEMTEYQNLSYDEDALKQYCNGDELMEYYFTEQLKKLKHPPKFIWNRYYHLFHQLSREFREQVLRFHGKKIIEVFDVPGSDMHMFAKLIESTDVKEKDIIKFQYDVKHDFRTLFGICKRTGKANAYVKTAFKKYFNSKKNFYSNIRGGSICWHIDQYFQDNYPSIRELLINWEELDITGETKKGLWADMMWKEFEVISTRLSNLLWKEKQMHCFTCHDAVYLTEDDAENITEKEIKEMFYEALDLLIDRQENFYNL